MSAVLAPERRPMRRLALMVALGAAVSGGSAAAFGQDAARTIAPDIVLDLNLPAFRLEVHERGAVTAQYRVAIGARGYPTPVGDFTIGQVIWNPIWVPPESPWARGETITAPGPSNPMQKVKFQVGGPYYIHGTPLVSSLGRAASHGCIRMDPADAMELARLLQRRTGVAISDAATDSLARHTRPTRQVVFPRPVLLRLRYEPAELRADTLTVHPDVYRRLRGGLRDAVMTVLASGGIDTTLVARDALLTLLTRASRGVVRIPVEDLLDAEATSTRDPLHPPGTAGAGVRPRPTPTARSLDFLQPGCEMR